MVSLGLAMGISAVVLVLILKAVLRFNLRPFAIFAFIVFLTSSVSSIVVFAFGAGTAAGSR
jgi:hypothetical protein